LPPEGSRRIVVLTDAVPTSAGLQAVSERLAADGAAADIVVSDTARSADGMGESVQVPAVSRPGEPAPVVAVLRSNQAGQVTVTFESADGSRRTEQVELEAGRTEVEVGIPSEVAGFQMVDVRVDATFDTRPDND